MNLLSARALRPGDRVHWELPPSITAGDPPCDGTVTGRVIMDGATHQIQIQWDDGGNVNMHLSGMHVEEWWSSVTLIQ